MWLKIREGIVVNLANVKYAETSGRYVVFHFINDTSPLMVPFENKEQSKEWLNVFFTLTKAQKNASAIDISKWKLN